MVKAMPILAIVAILAAPASAQGVDWRSAGGGLFAVTVPDPVAPSEPQTMSTPRISDLNQPFQEAIDAAAVAHGLDPKLLHALVVTESGYRPNALSRVGAGGLTQLMPGTALELGVRNRFDPVENLRGGADYLARQIVRFGDVRLALAAYNSGPARVARLGRVPDIQETRQYVATVVDCYLALTAGQAITNSRECRTREEQP